MFRISMKSFSTVTIFVDKLLTTFIGFCIHISVKILSKRYLWSSYKNASSVSKARIFWGVGWKVNYRFVTINFLISQHYITSTVTDTSCTFWTKKIFILFTHFKTHFFEHYFIIAMVPTWFMRSSQHSFAMIMSVPAHSSLCVRR